ncbi:MAG: hypothetical protein AB7G93_11560 [Bdellovibrionales bacterium]
MNFQVKPQTNTRKDKESIHVSTKLTGRKSSIRKNGKRKWTKSFRIADADYLLLPWQYQFRKEEVST